FLLGLDTRSRSTFLPYTTLFRSAFWIRDLDYLRSGPKLDVNKDYFELDGKPLAVIGTTYMSSEVQRLYFDHPNVYVWDQDLRQRSEEHTSELQSRVDLVCRLLLE